MKVTPQPDTPPDTTRALWSKLSGDFNLPATVKLLWKRAVPVSSNVQSGDMRLNKVKVKLFLLFSSAMNKEL